MSSAHAVNHKVGGGGKGAVRRWMHVRERTHCARVSGVGACPACACAEIDCAVWVGECFRALTSGCGCYGACGYSAWVWRRHGDAASQ